MSTRDQSSRQRQSESLGDHDLSNKNELAVASTYPTIDDYLYSALPPRDFTLTWTGYSGIGKEGEARYVLDGRSLGKGKEGFEAALKSVDSMPQGKTLLIWPSYAVQRLFTQNGPLDIPFRAQWGELEEAASRRGIHLLLVDRKIAPNITAER